MDRFADYVSDAAIVPVILLFIILLGPVIQPCLFSSETCAQALSIIMQHCSETLYIRVIQELLNMVVLAETMNTCKFPKLIYRGSQTFCNDWFEILSCSSNNLD